MEEDKNEFKDNLFISDLIRKVHEELIDSQAKREDGKMPPLFRVKELTLEVNFVVQKSAKKGGKLGFSIITAGMEKGIEKQQVHKITLKLDTILDTVLENMLTNSDDENDPNGGIDKETRIAYPIGAIPCPNGIMPESLVETLASRQQKEILECAKNIQKGNLYKATE